VLHVIGFRDPKSSTNLQLNGKYRLIKEQSSVKQTRPRYRKENLILSFKSDASANPQKEDAKLCDLFSRPSESIWQITDQTTNKCHACVESICWNPLDCPMKWFQAFEFTPVDAEELKDPVKWEQVDDVRVLTEYYSELSRAEVEESICQVVKGFNLQRGFPATICQLISQFVKDICIEICLSDIQGWWQTTKTECAFVLNNNCTFDNFGQQFPVVEVENEFLMNNWHLDKQQPEFFSNIVTWTGGQQWNTSVKWFRLPSAPSKFIQPMITVNNACLIEVNGEYIVHGQSDAVPKFRREVNDNLYYEIARTTVLVPDSDNESNEQVMNSANWYIYKVFQDTKTKINLYRAPHVTNLPVPPHSHWTTLIQTDMNHQLNESLEIEFNQQARRLQRILPPLETGPVYIDIILPSHIESDPEHSNLKVRETTCDAQVVSLVKSFYGEQLVEENLHLSINGVLYDLNSRECVKPGKYRFFYPS